MKVPFNPCLGVFKYEAGRSWRFKLTHKLVLQVDRDLGVHRFEDKDGKTWLTLVGNTITIPNGYAWDGSSPKWSVGNYWIGTPDYEASRAGSCVHDALYQFLHCPCFPLKRLECDELFREIMTAQGFKLSWVYATAVKVFGPPFYWVGTMQGRRTGKCVEPVMEEPV